MLTNGVSDKDALVVADSASYKAYAAGSWGLVGRTGPSGRHGDESAEGRWVEG